MLDLKYLVQLQDGGGWSGVIAAFAQEDDAINFAIKCAEENAQQPGNEGVFPLWQVAELDETVIANGTATETFAVENGVSRPYQRAE